MAEEEVLEEEEQEATEEKKGKSKLLIIGIAVLVVLIAAGGAGFYFMSGKGDSEQAVADESAEGEDGEEDEDGEDGEDEEVVRQEAYYFSLDPAFVVNFQGKSRARFLQVNIDGLTRKESVKLDVTKHLPQIRNNIVLLLSSKKYDDLISPEGKDTLRNEVLKEIQSILEEETGEEGVEDIFFTSFVMQ